MDIDFYIKQFTDIFSNISTGELLLKPSEWAERHVVLTSDVTSMPGRFSYDITPYMREIIDRFYPYDDAKIVALMAGAQLGKTQALIVNAIVYSIANCPGTILSLSRDDMLSAEFIESRLDPVIQSSGIHHLIRPSVIRKKNSRTGDTSKSKEFAGGRLFAGGMQSIKKLVRQRSIKYGWFDDYDSAPRVDKEEGDLFSLLQNRFKTFKNEMKQYYISTPTTRPSNIEEVYLKGDMREWRVPCPRCGEYIELKWDINNDRKFGVLWEVDSKGIVKEETVRYKCQLCGGEFDESYKYDMNLKGRWFPTSTPEYQGFYSYHISSIYAPPHSFGWVEMAREWQAIFKDGNENKAKKKAFLNQVLGIPYEESSEQIESNRLIYNTRDYEIGTIPDDLSQEDGNGNIVLLTCACDLNGTIDDARLDYDVWAHSSSGAIYSIDAGSIGTFQPGRRKEGRTKWTYRHGAPDNVWDMLENIILKRYNYSSRPGGMSILIVGIDVGYYDNYAWEFINKHSDICIGIKGSPSESFININNDKRLIKRSVNNPLQYNLESNLIKDLVAGMINLRWDKKSSQPEGFMNFPNPGNNKYTPNGYFVQYEAEHKILKENANGDVIGWRWDKKKSSYQNHFFDVACYNMACRFIFLDNFFRAYKMKQGTWFDYVDIANNILNE